MALIMAFKGCSIFLLGFSNNSGINNISLLRYEAFFQEAERQRKTIMWLFGKHCMCFLQNPQKIRFCECVLLQANPFLTYAVSQCHSGRTSLLLNKDESIQGV